MLGIFDLVIDWGRVSNDTGRGAQKKLILYLIVIIKLHGLCYPSHAFLNHYKKKYMSNFNLNGNW